MNTQLHLAFGIDEGRARADRDLAQLRVVERARTEARRSRRATRRRAG